MGAWYETMAAMSGKSKQAKAAIGYMARFAGGTEAEFRAQLRTTQMFYTAAEAVAFAESKDLKNTMEYVRAFCFDHGLYGDAGSKDLVGIAFPDGTVMGDNGNVKLRFRCWLHEDGRPGSALAGHKAEFSMARKKPLFYGIHADPAGGLRLLLAMLPFILVLAVYLTAADVRTRANPQEKLLPTGGQDGHRGPQVCLHRGHAHRQLPLVGRHGGQPETHRDRNNAVGALCGLLLGLNMGLLPGIRSLSSAFITFAANVPPLALLPVLFIALGVGEVSQGGPDFRGHLSPDHTGHFSVGTQDPHRDDR